MLLKRKILSLSKTNLKTSQNFQLIDSHPCNKVQEGSVSTLFSLAYSYIPKKVAS